MPPDMSAVVHRNHDVEFQKEIFNRRDILPANPGGMPSIIDPSNHSRKITKSKSIEAIKEECVFTCKITKLNVAECHCASVGSVCLLPILVEIHAIEVSF